MSPHDHGVTEMLRRASDDLTPDVDRLVGGGIARGRSRRRRARIGTTIASLAVIGVVGGLAVVVPRLAGPDGAGRAEVATDGGGTPSVEPPPPAWTERALADFRAGEVPAIVNEIVGTGLATQPRPTDTVVDDPDEKVAYFPYGGMQTAVGMGFNQVPTLDRCEETNAHLDGTCTELDDGTVQLSWGPTLADGVTCQGVSAYRYGYVVWANSCNAATAKDSPPLAPQPPLSFAQLASVATSEVWFG